jgi:hypothetical protein
MLAMKKRDATMNKKGLILFSNGKAPVKAATAPSRAKTAKSSIKAFLRCFSIPISF